MNFLTGLIFMYKHVTQQCRPLSSAVRTQGTRVRLLPGVNTDMVVQCESGGGAVRTVGASVRFLPRVCADVFDHAVLSLSGI